MRPSSWQARGARHGCGAIPDREAVVLGGGAIELHEDLDNLLEVILFKVGDLRFQREAGQSHRPCPVHNLRLVAEAGALALSHASTPQGHTRAPSPASQPLWRGDGRGGSPSFPRIAGAGSAPQRRYIPSCVSDKSGGASLFLVVGSAAAGRGSETAA